MSSYVRHVPLPPGEAGGMFSMDFSPEAKWPDSAVTVTLRGHPRLPPIDTEYSCVYETCNCHLSLSQLDARLHWLLLVKLVQAEHRLSDFCEQERLQRRSQL